MNTLNRIAERAVRMSLSQLEHGRLVLTCGGTTSHFGGGDGPSASIQVTDPFFFRSLAFGGHIGAAESYVRGEWVPEDLPALMRLFAANRAALDGLEKGWRDCRNPSWPCYACGTATLEAEVHATFARTTIWGTTSSRHSSTRR